MTVPAKGAAASSQPGVGPAEGPGGWTPRERQLLAVTLAVLQEVGYDRMTVDEVAARAQASKATVYRRWPSKADLVVAAFADGVRPVAVPPNTGSLREDLLQLARVIADQTRIHTGTMVGVLPELRRNAALTAVMRREWVDRRKALIQEILRAAAERGEIEPAAISDEIWDVLPGYLVFRSLMPAREITEQTLLAVVDDLLMPSLTRHRGEPTRTAASPTPGRGRAPRPKPGTKPTSAQ